MKRARKVKGSKEDKGRYFHCVNCDFVCDSKRDYYVNESDKNGLTFEQFITDDKDELVSDWDDFTTANWTVSEASIVGNAIVSSGDGKLTQETSCRNDTDTWVSFKIELQKGEVHEPPTNGTCYLAIVGSETTISKTVELEETWVLYNVVGFLPAVGSGTVSIQIGGEGTIDIGKGVEVRYPRLSYERNESVSETVLSYKIKTTKGCPFCGCLNWKG